MLSEIIIDLACELPDDLDPFLIRSNQPLRPRPARLPESQPHDSDNSRHCHQRGPSVPSEIHRLFPWPLPAATRSTTRTPRPESPGLEHSSTEFAPSALPSE